MLLDQQVPAGTDVPAKRRHSSHWAGKTTLVRRVLGPDGTLARLDDEATLQAAVGDPGGTAGYGSTPRGFDEVQRAGDPLIRAIKAIVDEDATPGRQGHHLRDRDGVEVDVVAEASDGRVVAIEVKTSTSVDPKDARHLAWLRDQLADDFVCGIVLHAGPRAYRLGDRIIAAPFSHLWVAGGPA